VIRAALVAAVLAVTPASHAVRYLDAHRSSSGCVGDASLTAWSAIAFAAGGDRAAAKAAGACLAAHAGEIRNATDRELFILGLVAARRSPRAVGGRNLVTELERSRLGGYYGSRGATNGTIFGILALRAAGRTVPKAVLHQLLVDQAASGGFSFYPKGTEVDLTAAAIEALVAAGYRCSEKHVVRARKALARLRSRDGGFPIDPGGPSNVQSTAWAVQAAAACHKADAAAIRYLVRQQASDGSIRYGTRPRLWPTAQAIPALFHRALPVR
jgi:hypothetical protein